MSTVLSMPIQRGFALLVTLALVLAAMVPLVTPMPTRASSHVWINEIHYDNDGTDTGEAIEVAGAAGTDLTGWSIVLYNGNGGAPYGTDALSGVLTNQQGGFGTAVVDYPENGIQNGAPDGVALVDGNGAVVQFLSYEGQFTAVGGPADGMVSNEMTHFEAGNTTVGHSLQLVGRGSEYANFSWEVAQRNTFGAVNTGQTVGDGSVPLDAVINEFSANTVGTTDVEFVEVFSTPTTDLSGVSILEIEGDTTGAGTVDHVIAVGTTDGSGFWQTGLASGALENGTITLLLVTGFTGSAGNDLDTDNDGTFDATPWTALVDSVAVSDGDAGDLTYGLPTLGVSYDGLAFAPGGASRIPDGTDTDTAADWVRNDFDLAGIGTNAGTPLVGEAYNTPGAPNQAVTAEIPTGITISQVYGGGGNSGATLTNDFVELYNTTAEPIDLAGWSVQYAGASGSTWQVTDLTGTIAPGGYYLVQEAAGTGGTTLLPLPDATGDISMAAQNGKVALVPTDDALSGTCPLEATVDFVGYGSADCFEGTAAAPALSNTTAAIRDDGGATDTDDNAADFTVGAPNPRNSTGTGPIDPCTMDATLISAVQGSAAASTMVGDVVAIRGVVVGDFQNNAETDDGELNGFYVQEEDADADGLATTSEGIFVFRSNPDVSAGDLVTVMGTVAEFGNEDGTITQLNRVSLVRVCDEEVPRPAATSVELPVSDPSDFERWEGMLVTFRQKLTISEFFNYDRYGRIVLTVGRDFQPTAVYEPDSDERAALAEENLLNRVTLDDGQTDENPDFTRHPNGEAFTLENRFRGGDTLTNVIGVIDGYEGYQIQPTEGADYAATNPRPEAPEDVGGSLTAASFNVLNYFTTVDRGPDICGPDEDQDCRGADSAEELERQQAKIVAALAEMDADVVGLIEIENHPGDEPTATLVDALNAVADEGTYDYIATGAIGTDAIRVAMIYKPATVTPVGDFAILDSTVDERFNDDENRPVLAQAFEENATGGVFTMAVNHLKSKGSACPDGNDPVQGNCNLSRTLAAEALVDWLATDPTRSGDRDALIIGDLNAYDKEDPIDAIREAGYTDLVHAFEGELAYSYLFDAQLGYLDTALGSPSLTPQVTGTTVWHINADEPDLIDYDVSFKSDAQDALWARDAYRSSDHDPVIVGLNLMALGDFEPPIGAVNDPRAGSTVPVKFSLGGDFGLDVLLEPPQVYDCANWPAGDGEDADTTGATGLRYDADADVYVFTWKTEREWAGECKTLVVTLDDGTYATATFDFR